MKNERKLVKGRKRLKKKRKIFLLRQKVSKSDWDTFFPPWYFSFRFRGTMTKRRERE